MWEGAARRATPIALLPCQPAALAPPQPPASALQQPHSHATWLYHPCQCVDAPHAGGWGGLEAAENDPDGNTGVLLSVPDGAPSLGCLSRLLYSEAAQSTGNTPVRCWALGGLVGQGECKLPTSPFPPGSR